MERLSEKAIEIINELHTERLNYNSEYLPLIDAANRLASYEETGLEPEEVKNWQDIYNEILTRTYGPFHQKIADMLKAEQEGRLVMLFAKHGDTVYVVGTGRIMECCINEIRMDSDAEYYVSFNCDNNCEGCPFNTWAQEWSGDWSCDGEYGHGAVKGSDFGKTVFLDPEEAEEALEQKMEGST